MLKDLRKREVNGGLVGKTTPDHFQLTLPESDLPGYSLAQVDDYMHLRRQKFPHTPPLRLQLEAKLADSAYKGTWGFGLWNDPFSMVITAGGMSRILPVPPNAAWFFFGSDENYLSLRNDVPGSGFQAQTFRSPRLPPILSVFGLPALPLLLCPVGVRLLRKLLRGVVKEDSKKLHVHAEIWHTYCLDWHTEGVEFEVDGEKIFHTNIAPTGRLGLVIWIDNQFFRLDPDGKLKFGALSIPTKQSLEVRNLTITEEGGYA